MVTGKKQRPRRLEGWTYRQQTPTGTLYVTINHDDSGQPFEVFIKCAKAGSETAAVSEAIGRLISYVLRLEDGSVSPAERLEEIARQLSGIGGSRPLAFGESEPHSLADGVARVLQDYLADTALPDGLDMGEAIMTGQRLEGV